MRSGNLLLAAAVLAGCGSAPPVTVPTPVLPPAALLETCPEPQLAGDDNGALAAWALALRGALRLCNDDKAALQGWAKENSQ